MCETVCSTLYRKSQMFSCLCLCSADVRVVS